MYVSYLRRKLEAGGEPRLIHTVRSVGYVLREPDDEPAAVAWSCFTAAAVAFAVVLSAVACYLAVRSSIRGRLDHQLHAQASLIVAASSTSGFPIRARVRACKPGDVRFPRPSLQNQGDLALLSASGTVSHRGPATRRTSP